MSEKTAWVFKSATALSLLLFSGNLRADTPDTILHSFSQSDGANPVGGLVLVGSTLYGTTSKGGTSNDGTLFKVNTDGTGFTVLHSFTGGSDSFNPVSNLTVVGSTIYGTTVGNSFPNSPNGTVFSINADGTGYTVLHSFLYVREGYAPAGGLVAIGSTLYGTTSQGGAMGTFGTGTIYKMNLDGSGYAILDNFTAVLEGKTPKYDLAAIGSTLYGVTTTSGVFLEGTIYSYDTSNPAIKSDHQFEGPPSGKLTVVGSKLYGTSSLGGGTGLDGTIYSINSDGTGYTTVKGFVHGASTGYEPASDLTAIGSTLFGLTTDAGGPGKVFSMNTDGSSYSVLHQFGGSPNDGFLPEANLVFDGSYLYGVTNSGGSLNDGTIYAIQVPEPSALSLAVIGLTCLIIAGRRH